MFKPNSDAKEITSTCPAEVFNLPALAVLVCFDACRKLRERNYVRQALK